MKDKLNSFWLATQYVLSIVIAFLMIKINILHFGEELFGMWLIFFSIWNMGIALDLGFGTSLVKFIAEADSKNNEKDVSVLVSNGLVFYAALGVLIFTICITIINIFILNNQNIVPLKYLHIAREISILLGINFYFQYLAYSLRSAFEGIKNFVLSSRILLFYNFSNLFVVLIAELLGLSMVTMAACLIISSFTYLTLSLIFFKKNHRNIVISPLMLQRVIIKKLLKFSVHVQMASIFNALIEPVVKYIIGNYYSLSLVTLYDIGRKVTISVSGLFFATFKTLLPKTSALGGREESAVFFNNQVAEISRLGIIYSGLMFGILSIAIAVVLKVVFVSSTILLVLVILALPETINNFGYSVYIFLLGIGKVSFLALIQFINLILTIVGLFIGFKIFNSPIGLLGYFVSVLIGNILMLLLVRNLFSVNLKVFFSKVKILKLVFLIILLLSCTLLNYFNDKMMLVNFSFLAITSLLLFYKDLKILMNQLKSTFQNIFPKLMA